MLKNKKQRIIFGIIMSYAMAYGMEIYNVPIKEDVNLIAGGFSNMTSLIFWKALKKLPIWGYLYFYFPISGENVSGQRLQRNTVILKKIIPYICQLLRQGGTVAIMCPTMSLVASILFNIVLAGAPIYQLPAIWIGTHFKNFPMAFFWNMFAAAPFTHWICGKLFANS